jgi:outer membrane protein assembly factor BamB
MKLEISMFLCILIGLHLGCVNRTFTAPIEDPINIDTSQYLKVLWDSEYDVSAPLLDFHNGKVIIANRLPNYIDSAIIALDGATGNLAWSFGFTDMSDWSAPATSLIVKDGIVTYNTKTSTKGIIGLDVNSGSLLWTQTEPSLDGFTSPRYSVFGGSVYAFNQSNEIIGPEASFVRFDHQNPIQEAFELLRDDNYESLAHEKLFFSGADF